MKRTGDRRTELTQAVVKHLLAKGLGAASLRTIAAAVGTSDRMLLHYFPDKAALMAAALGEVARQMAVALDAVAIAPTEFDALLRTVWGAVRDPAMAPYMRLWIEVAAAAGRGEEPYRTIGGAIADGFTAWAEAHLDMADPGERRRSATLLLATIDGLALLDAVGKGDDAAAAVAGGGTVAHITG